jgi:N-acetyl-anhydromuramyl-L-alanine amidase AmpD
MTLRSIHPPGRSVFSLIYPLFGGAMSHPKFDAESIFGICESGGEEYMLGAKKRGWILFNEAIGQDPNDRSGKDYTAFSDQGLAVIVCLNHGYFPQGTLPPSSQHANFARRCANFVAASPGCHTWVIGNEMNYAVQRPLADDLALYPDPDDPFYRGLAQRHNALIPDLADPLHEETTTFAGAGESITPERYAHCYRLCRNAIHTASGHAGDRVLIGAVCPWNTHTLYAGNPQGDWIKYFQDILMMIGPNTCDGITLHAYSHGADPSLIVDETPLGSFPQHTRHFQVYRDFMRAIPPNMRQLPVYITETNQGAPWEDANTGWIQEAYAEIDRWNRQTDTQKIRSLILYRWTATDRWHIEGKSGVIRDFSEALRHPYLWQEGSALLGNVRMPEATPVSSQAAVNTPSGPRYRVEWLGGQLPKPLYAGDVITFPLTVRNLGGIPWPQRGEHPVYLSYRLYQNQSEVALAPERQLLSILPKDVEPDESVTIQAQVALPDKEGNYTLIMDLLHEGITWFQEHQSDTLIRWMTVLPSTGDRPTAMTTPQAGLVTAARRATPLPRPTTSSRIGSFSAPESRSTFEQPPVEERFEPVAAPEIEDVRATLPRADHPYLRRQVDQIRYVVLNHTGAPPVVPIETLAQTHVNGGYPGIAYNYFITQSGKIYQVADDEEAAADYEWSLNGLNIGLEGDFNQQAPPREQIEATADLCAWLIGQFPQIRVDQVVGLCDLIETASPGLTFREGPMWQRRVEDAIQMRLRRQPARSAAPAPRRPALPMPAIEDITTRLQRDPEGFFSRRPEDITSIIINHTGVDADYPLDVITDGFREYGLPGILYQYLITGDGTILQTQPLLQVVDGERSYIANAINVAFAGSFDQTIPTPAQIQAGGALIAWLLSAYPQLTPNDITGVSELLEHNSPGDQWLQGQRWKDLLLRAVQSATERPAQAPARSPGPEVHKRIQQMEQELRLFQQQVAGLRAENERLHREIGALRADPQRVHSVPQPEIIDAVNQLPRHPTLHYDERRRSTITHVAIHHTAVPPHIGPERIAELHISEDPERGKRPWPGIGYHFFVHADGRLVRTQPLERIAYHAAGHNEYTLGIVFAGSFMNGHVPTPAQLSAGAALVAWLLQDLRIPLQQVWGHREFPDNNTTCPGSEWLSGRKWRDMLYNEIVSLQRGERT